MFTPCPPLTRAARHSILKTRLGATPLVEVKMPHGPPGQVSSELVSKSSQCAIIVLLKVLSGKHTLA